MSRFLHWQETGRAYVTLACSRRFNQLILVQTAYWPFSFRFYNVYRNLEFHTKQREAKLQVSEAKEPTSPLALQRHKPKLH